jgi:hypothetical protein
MVSGSPEQKEEALAAGASEFLDKHVNIEVIWEHVKGAIERASANSR